MVLGPRQRKYYYDVRPRFTTKITTTVRGFDAIFFLMILEIFSNKMQKVNKLGGRNRVK